MALHARVPSGRSRASLSAIGDETDLANQQALRGLVSSPKDPSGFDQNSLGENIATLQRARQEDFSNAVAQMRQPSGMVMTPTTSVMPRAEDLLLTQALSERGGKVRGGPDGLLADTGGQGTLPLSLQGLDGASYGYDQFGMPTSASFGRRPLTKEEQDAQRQAAQPKPWSLG